MLALGAVVMLTLAVVLTAEQPPAAAIVYVTVYVPAVLVLGVISPVLAFMLKPVVEEYVPPVVPV
jgi:NADH:ubiquinone oxidoreductase subunit 6 (subunit J)